MFFDRVCVKMFTFVRQVNLILLNHLPNTTAILQHIILQQWLQVSAGYIHIQTAPTPMLYLLNQYKNVFNLSKDICWI